MSDEDACSESVHDVKSFGFFGEDDPRLLSESRHEAKLKMARLTGRKQKKTVIAPAKMVSIEGKYVLRCITDQSLREAMLPALFIGLPVVIGLRPCGVPIVEYVVSYLPELFSELRDFGVS